MSDFGWFSEGFNFSMFNMFTWFYHILLISEVNSCPILMFQNRTRINFRNEQNVRQPEISETRSRSRQDIKISSTYLK